ncbi:cell division protein CrgA [Zafaria cholistanensis]|uniref:Cell division protein CrgA n=1 Tax=Zafaria cholistanensis TaxID=1682741 RepID=A0A5A7NS63_9MICC|nr:cell division protein CrgA [Zafaria cholistanensis]GER22952.1 cell division protein CrgA [Zafaria cholistanensis]
MPESKTRRKNRRPEEGSGQADYRPLPVWYKPVMFGLMLLGLLWIMVYYISQGVLPLVTAGGWNIVIGFGLAMVGFFMTTRWR